MSFVSLLTAVLLVTQVPPTKQVAPEFLHLPKAAVKVAEVDIPIEAVAKPRDAAEEAKNNIQEVYGENAAACKFKRYTWIPPSGDFKWPGLVSYGTNSAVSKSSVIQQPYLLAKGSLLRWDLRLLAPDPDDLVRLTALWELLAVHEPYFHVTEGKTPAFAPHLNPETMRILSQRTGSANPIIRADWYLIKILTTLKGGRYYDFMNFVRNPKAKGVTAKQFLLESIGANERDSDIKGGDQRKAMFFSEVTGKPRLVSFFHGRAGRMGEGRVWLTSDISDDDLNPSLHPMLNLLHPRFTAQELIYELPNGLHGFALFNKAGAFQNSVPPNVARDHTIPAPFTDNLEPAYSCIRCHGPDDGVKPVVNDVAMLWENRTKLNPTIFDDISNQKISTIEALDIIAGRFAGGDSFDRKLARGRDDLNEAIWRATGGTKGPDSITKESAAGLGALMTGYRYTLVDAQRACLDLGYRVPPEKALLTINRLLRVPPGGFDDPRLLSLKEGRRITIDDWEAVYSDAALRAELNVDAETEELQAATKK